MKVKAPKKVYLHLTKGNYRLNGTYYEHKPAKIRIDDKIIEYTRTDAFIEKVYDYLKNYAFVDDDKNVHLPTLLHVFLKDSRNF